MVLVRASLVHEQGPLSLPKAMADTCSIHVDYDCRASGLDVSCGSKTLLDIAQQAKGLSGRLLRKLPLVAVAFYSNTALGKTLLLDVFLAALTKAIVDRTTK